MSHRSVLSIRNCKLHIKFLWQRFKYACSIIIDTLLSQSSNKDLFDWNARQSFTRNISKLSNKWRFFPHKFSIGVYFQITLKKIRQNKISVNVLQIT